MALSGWTYDTQGRKTGNSKTLFPTVSKNVQVNMKTCFVDIKPQNAFSSERFEKRDSCIGNWLIL